MTTRLTRNGRDCHHLIELRALARRSSSIDNDHLLLGLNGKMSDYELSQMRQRDLAIRDWKVLCGKCQFMRPPGFALEKATASYFHSNSCRVQATPPSTANASPTT
jgi:hypothetical protein